MRDASQRACVVCCRFSSSAWRRLSILPKSRSASRSCVACICCEGKRQESGRQRAQKGICWGGLDLCVGDYTRRELPKLFTVDHAVSIGVQCIK